VITAPHAQMTSLVFAATVWVHGISGVLPSQVVALFQ
jgi:hypothetical protein